MTTANTSISDKEIKIEGENVSRKDEVKVTNLLSEIRTTDLPKESAMQVDQTEKCEEKDSTSKSKEGELKDIDNRIDSEKGKEKQGDKKEEEAKKVNNGAKTAKEVEKLENGNKKVEEGKKAASGEKIEEGVKKVEKSDKKTDDKKNENSQKSSKTGKLSPLAAYFLDWDKFTTKQKVDIERFIREKAERMGASSKLKPGVRTFSERERNWFRWNAIRNRRRREAIRRMESSRSERPRPGPPRDRYPPTRSRGAGDARYRNPRDDRRLRRYSPRRESVPWRSPWASASMPVENLLKQMERFVQMVDKFPHANNIVPMEPKRLALLPTPNGYISSRANGLDDAIKDKPLLNTEKTFAPSPRWPVQQFKSEESSRRFYGKEPTSRDAWKQRPSPYNSRSGTPYSSTVLRNGNWSNRERTLSHTTGATPFQESRYNWTRK
ncbi:unnamed protein product [Nezara viridula]|uniref:Uncharacterized protein n=1 Tax=Nezara viridula TaxID=85310 RepID=A0A9P0MMK6_NEZVI|nr:unnamed protein product [Nezara viridula]